jgi:hypothetical protein
MDGPASVMYSHLVELLQVAKQFLLDFGSIWPDFLPHGCKYRASYEDMVDWPRYRYFKIGYTN